MPTVQMVTGSGTTRTADGYRLSRWPWIFLGGSVTSYVVAGATGDMTYYGLDNSTYEVLRLGCYHDVVIAPQYEEFDQFCDGVKTTEQQLTEFIATVTVTEDIVDLYFLQTFLRQRATNYNYSATLNIESLLVGDLVDDVMPVLFEHHYSQATSTADEYVAIVGFEAQVHLGDITGNYTEGYSAELTINIRFSNTYDGYLGLMRHDDVAVV